VLRQRYQATLEELDADSLELLRGWPERRAGIRTPQYSYTVRGSDIRGDNYRESLSRLQIPKIGAPDHASWGGLLAFLRQENLPGYYPYTAGVFPYRREGEDPTRMFAGEGTPERTNRRFHFVARGQPANRLSTAFDSVTLYGEDPAVTPRHLRQGRQLRSVDRDRRRLKKLYSGFDLCDPEDLGVDDDQRSGADDPGLLHERRDRPAGREAPEGRAGSGRPRRRRSTRTSQAAHARATRARCPRATTASDSGCSVSAVSSSSTPRPTP
jgi:hypothetical protein